MTDETRQLQECEAATDDLPLRQGDVFEWLTRADGDPFRQFGVVVTADCDIAHDKHQGIVSYVPVLPFTDYLRLFVLPRRVRKTLAKVADELVAAVRKCQLKLAEFPEPMSEETIRDWVGREPAGEVLKALGLGEGKVATRIAGLIHDCRALRAALADGAFFEAQVEALAGQWGRANQQVVDVARDRVVSELVESVENLPGDAFFVGTISDGAAQGHVAYLRLVREVRHEEVAIRATELATAKAKRISRMTSPYLYHLTQQLAAVFAAIGLPVDYEEQRRRIGRAALPARLVAGEKGSQG